MRHIASVTLTSSFAMGMERVALLRMAQEAYVPRRLREDLPSMTICVILRKTEVCSAYAYFNFLAKQNRKVPSKA